jgi:hypothetical protein
MLSNASLMHQAIAMIEVTLIADLLTHVTPRSGEIAAIIRIVQLREPTCDAQPEIHRLTPNQQELSAGAENNYNCIAVFAGRRLAI